VAGAGPDDIVSRWEGTRFMIISPHTKKALLLLLAEKIRVSVRMAIDAANHKEAKLDVSMAGTMSTVDDTLISIKQRVVANLQQSETQTGVFILNE
jgi:GGDEF domain-containing protein